MRVISAAMRTSVPVTVAVVLAVATASISRVAPSPRLIQLSSHAALALEEAGLSTGPAEAPVVVRVVADYECGACEALDRGVGRVLRGWAREGRIRYQLIHAPLGPHRRAPKAAAAFYCADQQNAAWLMHELIVTGRATWGWGSISRCGLPELRRGARAGSGTVRRLSRRGGVARAGAGSAGGAVHRNRQRSPDTRRLHSRAANPFLRRVARLRA